MIKDIYRSYKNDNRGSAIITGLVVSAVLMVLCLSLLLVSYSLFISTSESTSDMQNREMLYSAAEAIEHELTDVTVLPVKGTEEDPQITYRLISDKNETPAVVTDDTTEPEVRELEGHDLWKDIYKNIWQGFNIDETDTITKEEIGGFSFYKQNETDSSGNKIWPYFDAKAAEDAFCSQNSIHADIEKCSRYFNLTSVGSTNIVLQLYWELPNGFDGNIYSKAGTILNAVYMLYDNSGEMLVKTKKKYILTASNDDASIVVQSGVIPEFSANEFWGGYIGLVSITNNSDSVYESWMMILTTSDEIKLSSFNTARVNKIDDNNYFVRYQSYNQDINPGNSVGFQFESATTYSSDPQMKMVKAVLQEVDRSKYHIDLTVPSYVFQRDSENVYQYNMDLRNTSDTNISDWRLQVTLKEGQRITGYSNFNILSQEGNTYVLCNNDNVNSDIGVSGKVSSLYLEITGGDSVLTSEDFTMSQLIYDPNSSEEPEGISTGVNIDHAGNWKWNRVGEELLSAGGDGE